MLYRDGMWPLAGLVFVTTILMPLLQTRRHGVPAAAVAAGRARRIGADVVFRLLQLARAVGHDRSPDPRLAGRARQARAYRERGAGHRAVVVRRADAAARAPIVRAFDPARVLGAHQRARAGGGAPAERRRTSAAAHDRRARAACSSATIAACCRRRRAHAHDARCPRCGAHLHFASPTASRAPGRS